MAIETPPRIPSREDQKTASRFMRAHLGQANRARVEIDVNGQPYISAFAQERDEWSDTEFEGLRVTWRRGSAIHRAV